MQYNNRPFFAQIIVKFIEQQRYYRVQNVYLKCFIQRADRLIKILSVSAKNYYSAETFNNYYFYYNYLIFRIFT